MAEDFDENLDEEELVEENEDAVDEELEQEEQANRQIVLNRFKQMKSKYLASSSIWPFLTPNQRNICNRVKKISPGEYTAFMKMVDSKKAEFYTKIQTAASAVLPILPLIILGLLIIVGIIVVISFLMPWLTGSSTNPSSPFGANGKNFYGVRYVYRDAEQAKVDLWADYVGAMNYTIQNFDDENITLKIDLPAEDLLTNIPTIGVDSKYASAYNMVLEIAKTVYLADNADIENVETAIETLGVDEILEGIKYFGFDAQIVMQIAANWAEFIETDNTLYALSEESSVGTIDVSATLMPKFAALLLDEYVTKLQLADGAPTRTDLLYIKDYILANEESTVEDIAKEDYVAMVYLPKANAKISSVTYNIYGVNTEDYTVALWKNGAEIVSKNEETFTIFSSKQESETEFDDYHFVASNIDISALTMTDFQKEFLTTEKSLMGILQALKTENGGANSALASQYLQEADAENTAFWSDGLQDESETKYLTFSHQAYLSVLMNNSAATPYMFSEFETNLG